MKRLFLTVFFMLSLAACDQDKAVEVVPKQMLKNAGINSSQDMEAATTYKAEIVPKKMTVQEKKKRFRYLLVPSVKRVYQDLDTQYKKIKMAIKSGTDVELINQLKKEYKADSDKELLLRLKPHPVSIVLAQAAMESAWATSRFFVEAKNIFGVWSFNKNEPRIAAGEKRGNKTIWLKKYSSIDDAVRDNYRVLARGAAFVKFRNLRMNSNNPFELVKGLDKYSELGSKYGKELASVIRFNKFNSFDL